MCSSNDKVSGHSSRQHPNHVNKQRDQVTGKCGGGEWYNRKVTNAFVVKSSLL